MPCAAFEGKGCEGVFALEGVLMTRFSITLLDTKTS